MYNKITISKETPPRGILHQLSLTKGDLSRKKKRLLSQQKPSNVILHRSHHNRLLWFCLNSRKYSEFKHKHIFTEPWSQCWTNLDILRPLWTTETAGGSRVQAKSGRLCGHVVPTTGQRTRSDPAAWWPSLISASWQVISRENVTEIKVKQKRELLHEKSAATFTTAHCPALSRCV